MAAIPYPDPETVPGLAQLYQEIETLGRGVLNLYRVMGHSPKGLRAYIGLSHFVRDQTTLPAQLRELAILQTGVSIGCEYEVAQHAAIARNVGVVEEKVEAILAGRTSDEFTEKERAVVDYARQVGESRRASDETLHSLRRLFSLREISELALTVGMYHLCAAVLMPLRVEND